MSSTETKKQREMRRLVNAARKGKRNVLAKARKKIQARIAERVMRAP